MSQKRGRPGTLVIVRPSIMFPMTTNDVNRTELMRHDELLKHSDTKETDCQSWGWFSTQSSFSETKQNHFQTI